MKDDRDEIPEDFKKHLPENLVEGLDAGSVVAISVPESRFNGRWFSILAALMVGVMLAPLWLGISYFAYICGYGLALGWMYVFFLMCRINAKLMLACKIERAVTKRMIHLFENLSNSDGTNEDETGLTVHEGKDEEEGQ